MAIFFIDSMAHYTTHAQLVSKWDGGDVNTVVAATGAFGAPGTQAQGGLGSQINFPSLTTLEVSLYWMPETQAVGSQSAFMTFSTTTGSQCTLWLYMDGTIKLLRGSATSGTELATSPAASVAFSVQHHLYVKVVFSQTVGTIDVAIDGTSVVSTTGLDNCSQAAADCTMLTLLGDGVTGRSDSVFSHVALANASGDITGRPRVQAIFPDGAGNYSQWVPTAGANYTNVDETTPNDDTDYVAESTVNDRDSYTYSNLLSPATTILAVAVVPRARTDDAAARTMKTFVRAGGTDYDHADTVSVPGSYGYLQQIYQTNPATAAAWTAAEVNSLEAGIKVVS